MSKLASEYIPEKGATPSSFTLILTSVAGCVTQWLGKAAYFILPALAVAALGVGFFASSTYDNGSTVFLRQ